jgi:hypothetical protein
MTTQTPDDADYDPGADDLLHDSHGNVIDSNYIDKVNSEAKFGYDLDDCGRRGQDCCEAAPSQ